MNTVARSAIAALGLLAGVGAASAQSGTVTREIPAGGTVTREVQGSGGAVTKETTTTTTTTRQTLTPEDRTVVRRYVTEQRRPSVRVQERVAVGSRLPASVELYAVEGGPGVSRYRYTIVNDEPVLVDPGTREVIEVLR